MNLNFTHGLCPTCLAEQMKAFDDEVQVNKSRHNGFP
jgi:hypothetical protein